MIFKQYAQFSFLLIFALLFSCSQAITTPDNVPEISSKVIPSNDGTSLPTRGKFTAISNNRFIFSGTHISMVEITDEGWDLIWKSEDVGNIAELVLPGGDYLLTNQSAIVSIDTGKRYYDLDHLVPSNVGLNNHSKLYPYSDQHLMLLDGLKLHFLSVETIIGNVKKSEFLENYDKDQLQSQIGHGAWNQIYQELNAARAAQNEIVYSLELESRPLRLWAAPKSSVILVEYNDRIEAISAKNGEVKWNKLTSGDAYQGKNGSLHIRKLAISTDEAIALVNLADDHARFQTYLVNMEDGNEIMAVKNSYIYNAEASLSPDGAMVLTNNNANESFAQHKGKGRTYLRHASDGSLIHTWRLNAKVAFFSADNSKVFMAAHQQAIIADTKSGRVLRKWNSDWNDPTLNSRFIYNKTAEKILQFDHSGDITAFSFND